MESRRIPINRPVAAFSGVIELSLLSITQAATIESCNPGNVTVSPPSEGGYTVVETYGRRAHTSTTKIETNGTKIWAGGGFVYPITRLSSIEPELAASR